MLKRVNIGMIGYKFMGKAHSHAFKDVNFFFDLGLTQSGRLFVEGMPSLSKL